MTTTLSAGYALALLALLALAAAVPDPIYTIHYVRSYRRDLIDNNFGCGKAVVYGTYLYPLGLVDALFALANSHVYGFNANCQRIDTYIKLFGEAQDYQKLIELGGNLAGTVEGGIGRTGVRKLVIEWKYLPESEEKREAARKALESLLTTLKGKGYTVFLKAPASFFCVQVGGKRYLLDLPAENFIVELYGEETGQYTTFESIFSNAPPSPSVPNGYSNDCPKFPTLQQLSAGGKKIFLEKTVDSSLPGYIGNQLQTFLEKAGNKAFNSMYFVDGYPPQTVEL